jgi:hypothetical protein
MEDSLQEKEKWYDKNWVPYVLLFLLPPLFPVGLYALWKNSNFSKNHKVITTSIIGVLFLYFLGSGSNDSLENVIEHRKAINSFYPAKGPNEDFQIDSTVAKLRSGEDIYVEKDTLGWLKYRTTKNFSSNVDGWILKENTTTLDDYEENYRERDEAIREIEKELKEEQARNNKLANAQQVLQLAMEANVIVNIDNKTRTVYLNTYNWNSLDFDNKKLVAKAANDFLDIRTDGMDGWTVFKDARSSNDIATYNADMPEGYKFKLK